MLRVTDHKDFCCFNYESEPSKNYQLGDVLTKDYSKLYEDSEQEIEVGVVIQTFSDGDFRTDMWGMSSESEVSPSTLSDIKKYRPKLIHNLIIGNAIQSSLR
jgi:hypothetical protein